MNNLAILYRPLKGAILQCGKYNVLLNFAVLLISLLITACGFQSQIIGELPQALQTVRLETSDPYGSLARALRRQLWLQHFKHVQDGQYSNNNPRLHIITTRQHRAAVSLFHEGKAAQYQITYQVQAKLHLTNHSPYPLTAAVRYTFFDNPMAALAKSSETEMIQERLCQQAARQLVLKMSHLLTQIAKNSPNHSPLPNTLSNHAPSLP